MLTALRQCKSWYVQASAHPDPDDYSTILRTDSDIAFIGLSLVITLAHDFPQPSLTLLEALRVCNFPCAENSGHWPASKPDHLKVVSPHLAYLHRHHLEEVHSVGSHTRLDPERFSNLLARRGKELMEGFSK